MNATSTTLNSMILVNTTNGADIPKGYVQLSANMREMKDKQGNVIPLDPAMRYRNAIIPELVLPASVETRFQSVLLEKLYAIAKAQFDNHMEESKRHATHIDPANYTLAGILAYYETDVTSGRMTKESVGAWFDGTDTAKFINQKDATQTAKYRGFFMKMASPNHGINVNTCRAMLAVMQEGDLDSAMGKGIANKLAATIEKSEVSQLPMLQ